MGWDEIKARAVRASSDPDVAFMAVLLRLSPRVRCAPSALHSARRSAGSGLRVFALPWFISSNTAK
eukprot:536543-Lingulodinium_polyedra.AAC.1